MQISDVPCAAKIEKENFSINWSEETFKSTLSNGHSYMIVAKMQDDIVGYAGMYSVAGEGYVYNVAVQKEFRCKGIGTALVKNMISYSKETKLKFLSLEVRKSNKSAIGLYEKLGFKVVGVRKSFYEKPIEDAIIMTNNINNF